MSGKRRSHVYGPVPSRRLGRSLGVDLVPFKVCSLNCIYCQLGATTMHTLERSDYTPVDEIVADVRAALDAGARPDYVTLGGSGEPTLHVYLDEILRRIRKRSDVPTALLTNGSLFFREDVRRDAALADVVLPSLDAPTAELFQRINRPHPDIDFRRYIDGLARFREEYQGKIWLEVFLVRGLNDAPELVEAFRDHIARIRPDRIHLNTAVRPTTDATARAVPPERMKKLRDLFGPTAEIISDFKGVHKVPGRAVTPEDILGLLRRRPSTVADVADGLGARPNEVSKLLGALVSEGRAVVEHRGPRTYYLPSPGGGLAGAPDPC